MITMSGKSRISMLLTRRFSVSFEKTGSYERYVVMMLSFTVLSPLIVSTVATCGWSTGACLTGLPGGRLMSASAC